MMKTIAFAAPTKYVTDIAKQLRAGGYVVEKTPDTCIGKTDTGEVIFRALKMRSVWAVRGDDRVFTPQGDEGSVTAG